MVGLGNFMLGTVKAYACTKFMQKTGMNMAEVLLYKDAFKTCNSYYSKKAALALKSIFAK